MSQLYKIQIRRNIGRAVKPESEQIDGKSHLFTYGWTMGEDDSYPDEIAYIPDREGWPIDAPSWIASGDLSIFEEL